MKNFFIRLTIIGVFLMACFSFSAPVYAAGSCFCSTVTKDGFSSVKDPKELEDAAKYDAACYDVDQATCVKAGVSGTGPIDRKYKECVFLASGDACQASFDDWKKAKDDRVQQILKGTREQRTELHNKGVIERLLPACVFESEVKGDCKNITIFIKVAIDIADYVLGIVGSLALVVFIYGGIMMIISEGHSDRVEAGKNAMVAALVGLIIVFGAYIFVKFFASVVGVQSGFNLL